MRASTFKAILVKTGFAASILLASSVSFAQSVVNLTAAPTQAVLPDGQSVPMWGYSCGTPTGATCAATNPAAAGNWSPVAITVPYTGPGTSLTINLTNNLPASIPTSLVIVGQLGGGLGGTPTTTPSPAHAVQGTTWPAAGDTSGAMNTPPAQPPRVQSFATEVAAASATPTSVQVASGSALTWSNLRPGTYLIESGTHPSLQGPMGLYGVLVVTSAPVAGSPNVPGTAYPGVSYDADVALLLSEIDPVQNRAVSTAVNTAGFSETSVIVMRDVVSSITINAGGSGYVVGDTLSIVGGGGNNAAAQVASVDGSGAITAITVTNPGTGYSSIPTSVTGGTGTGADLTAALLQAGSLCSNGAAACYPPAVNYDPRYYMINGVSFDRTQATNSLFAANSAYTATGNVLVRFVNAGLRMHVPSIVGTQTGTAASGFSLVAEDGNVLPGNRRVQTQVFMAAGKTYDVLINAPASGAPALPVFDRQLSLSTNNRRDGGMQGYIGVNGAAVSSGAGATASTAGALNRTYYCAAARQLAVTDPSKGVLAGANGANGALLGTVTLANPADLLSFNADGTFTYTPDPLATTCGGSFQFMVNGSIANTATITQCDASTPGCSALGSAPTAVADSYTSNVASYLKISPPGVLANDTDPSGLPLKVDPASIVIGNPGLTLSVNADGSFTASATTAGSYSFTYNIKNSQGTAGSSSATVTLTFPAGSGLKVDLADAIDPSMKITDYRWIIEEDRTWYSDPACQINTTGPRIDARGNACPPLPVESLAYSFHTANMPVIATGCTGAASCESGQTLLGTPAACDQGNGVCQTNTTQKVALDPGQVALDPNKRYFLSILPADSINPTLAGTGAAVALPSGSSRQFTTSGGTGNMGDCTGFAPLTGDCGHGMSGAPISGLQISAPAANPVTVRAQRTPLPTAQIAAFVYQDDNPLNGENDAGGGVDVLAPQEPGLGGFELKVFDQAGGLGDPTGQITYDMSNMPVSNALAGTIDPLTGQNACPITIRPDGIVGMVPVCPKYEADGSTLSPLAGQAIINNLYPGLYEIVATPAADRIGRGEEWLQTNTLDGGKAHEASIRPNEPSYFQEFGPGGFHVSIGFANPKIINDRMRNTAGTGLCDPAPNGGGQTCNSTLTVNVAKTHMARTPDQRVYSSGSYDAYNFTQCYIAMGPADGADFAFAKCDANGQAIFNNIPNGDWKLAVFDQWNDLTLDGLVSAVHVTCTPVAPATSCDTTQPVNLTQEFPVTQWRTNIMTRTFIDSNGNGVSNDDGTEPGLALVSTNIRYRDGSFGFFNNTDLNGYAGFNEVFPFMNWLVVEADTTRFKPTGIHSVYDTGGPVDGTTGGGTTTIANRLANTLESNSLPSALRVPGAKYCDTADCAAGDTFAGGSSGRVDPPMPWGSTQAWQGLLGQTSFVEFGMKPFVAGENGGIKGHVIYASTRPFDDPTLLLQLSWEPGVPRVQINLYQEGTAPDGTTSLKLVDTTKTTSWDDWAQGFRRDAAGNLMQAADGGYIPNMNCPGQVPDSPFFATLQGSRQFLDPDRKPLAANSQFKCFDGWAMLNQIQPAPYDGMYKFPSVTAVDPATGRPAHSNCTACVPNPDDGNPMLPAGKYVVEVIVPPGFELVKEEDKNILMGDIYVAPVAQQFAGLGNVFIMPDQAAVNAYYNQNNAIMPTTNQGSTTFPRHEGDTGSVEAFWPCVGALRVVPDFMSLYPTVGQNAPFAGALRPLCDRKEVTLQDQASALAKFYIFTPTHIAGHFTGTITNDFASEFDPFSPQFGEKFGPPNLPVSMRDFNGNEVNRVYGDQWGVYNGLFTSTWEVNPPNPTGYGPQMAVACMNDPGPIPDPAHPGQTMIDPAYSPAYSNFCYETPFMPGFTAYMDTPVVPVQAFADQYNLPDAEYPNNTPAVRSVTGDVAGPWVSASAHPLTITALGDKQVVNPVFAGPNAQNAPFNQKTITRHYGFGSTAGSVTIGGVNAPVTSWSDTSITVTVPATVPNCAMQQVGNSAQQCGELVITAANGKQSIDAVTVTVGGHTPTVLAAGSTIQSAIDAATPGDLIIVPAGTYKEHLIMWKPVRLQGVGANSTIINADAHPSGVMDPWRRQIACVFGLSLNGVPSNSASLGLSPPVNNFDPSGQYSCPDAQYLHVDRIAYEAIIGWDASGNGNLAQVLQEPTLMGAYEGAGITVLGRGVMIPDSGPEMYDFWGQSATGGAGSFADGSTWLTALNCTPPTTTPAIGRDYYTSNYYCNPSRIDGLAIINSSQGGGALFVHSWGHNIEIANNRIFANQGTLTGGINVGNGENPDAYLNDGTCTIPAITPCPPIPAGAAANQAIPFQFNTNVHVHHNAIYDNASIGDALYSGTPTGAGGVTVSAGSDGYRIDHNWIAGNLTTGDGGGIQHVGLSFNGKINNNWILFNQSTNPTLPTNGGGVAIMGANIDRVAPTPAMILAGIACGGNTDADCPPGQGDGAGGGTVVDSNLILGNSAESGSGGGLRLQQINGTETGLFPADASQWYDVKVTNNIIVNNVAGWDGAGVSLEDALKASIVNNTIASNDTTASAGVLYKTLGAANASSPPAGCDPAGVTGPFCSNGGNADHGPQPAGLVVMRNTPNLVAALGGTTTTAPTAVCPTGYGYSGTNCAQFSLPQLANNLFWQNRAFHVEIVQALGTGTQNQQALVAMIPMLNQSSTGFCASSGLAADGSTTPTPYWDIGVRGDLGVTDHSGGATLTVKNSILTNVNGYNTPVNLTLSRGIVTVGSLASTRATVLTNVRDGFSVGQSVTIAGVSDHAYNGTYTIVTCVPNLLVQCNASEFQILLGSAHTGLGFGGTASVTESISPNNLASNPLLLGQYCNGSRGAPENNGNMGSYNAPAGRSETTGLSTVFTFSNIAPAVTVDEGNNWINLVYGPLSMMTPASNNSGSTAAEKMLAVASVGVANGAYSIGSASPAIDGGANVAGVPNHDFFGNPRPSGIGYDIGAVELPVPQPIPAVSPAALAYGNVSINTTKNLALTVSNGAAATGNLILANPTITAGATGSSQPSKYSFTTTCPIGGSGVAPGASCTINVTFAPTAVTAPSSQTATLNVNATNATAIPVPLSGTGVIPTYTITPGPLAGHNFGNQNVGTSSGPFQFTLTNTAASLGNLQITGVPTTSGTFASQFVAAFRAGDTCTLTTSLAPGQSCRFSVVFAPTSTGAKGTGVLAPGARVDATVEAGAINAGLVGSPVWGTGVQAAVTFSWTNGGTVGAWGTATGTRTITVTNSGTAASTLTLTALPAVANLTGGSQFSRNGGTCINGTALGAGASCTVTVNRNRPAVSPFAGTGTLTVSDTGAATPTQVLNLSGS